MVSNTTLREIRILDSVFDPWQVQQDYQKHSMEGSSNFGATASFIGTMRDFNEGDEVSSMVLEHYPEMTKDQLYKIIDDANEKWSLLNVLIIHRVGKILPAEPIVLVTVWSSHRVDAFEACRYLMEELKHRAPFWKQEKLVSGEDRWVEKNTDGY